MKSKTYQINETHVTKVLNENSNVMIQNHSNKSLYFSINTKLSYLKGFRLCAGAFAEFNIKAKDVVIFTGDNICATIAIVVFNSNKQGGSMPGCGSKGKSKGKGKNKDK